jgi:hypothetical protein
VVSTSGLSLQPRLTDAAERELNTVWAILSSVALADGQDLRRLDSPSSPPFSSGGAYHMLSPRHAPDVSACTSWGLRLPSKVRIFSYLADIDKLSTRANLFYKSCAPSDICAACPSPETRRHLFFDCLTCGVGCTLRYRLEVSRSGTFHPLTGPPRIFGTRRWRVSYGPAGRRETISSSMASPLLRLWCSIGMATTLPCGGGYIRFMTAGALMVSVVSLCSLSCKFCSFFLSSLPLYPSLFVQTV